MYKAYLASVFFAISNISIWKTFDLGYILEQVYIKDILVSSKTLAHESKLFEKKDNIFDDYRHYDAFEKSNGAIFTFAGFSVAVSWSEKELSSSNNQVVSSRLLIFINLTKMFSKGNKKTTKNRPNKNFKENSSVITMEKIKEILKNTRKKAIKHPTMSF